jgi:hypothetical protein
VNLSVSEVLLIRDVVVPDELVVIDNGVLELPSKEGLMVPDAWIRVCVGLKGIKSINRRAFEGAASKRIAAAMPATPKSE